MTTHDELWNNVDFIVNRIIEQFQYLQEYYDKEFYSKEREQEVIESTYVIANKFYYRLAELGRNNAKAAVAFKGVQISFHATYGKIGHIGGSKLIFNRKYEKEIPNRIVRS